ncbi:MAG: VOC family protein [bacterium]
MLRDKVAVATLAVKSLSVARTFYEGVLGLESGDDSEPSTIVYRAGSTTILVYESQFAGTNRATAATWAVGGELDECVKTLKSKGAAFEHYDMPETKREGDIHIGGKMRVAWLKDPDGNIHAFTNQ